MFIGSTGVNDSCGATPHVTTEDSFSPTKGINYMVSKQTKKGFSQDPNSSLLPGTPPVDLFDKGCDWDVKGDTSGPLLSFPLFLTKFNLEITGDDSPPSTVFFCICRHANKRLGCKKLPHTRPATLRCMTIICRDWKLEKSTQPSWEVLA